MKKNYESVYRMKLTGYQVRTAIGILNERRLALKSQGCTLENTMFSRVFCYIARSERTSKNPFFKVSGLTHPNDC